MRPGHPGSAPQQLLTRPRERRLQHRTGHRRLSPSTTLALTRPPVRGVGHRAGSGESPASEHAAHFSPWLRRQRGGGGRREVPPSSRARMTHRVVGGGGGCGHPAAVPHCRHRRAPSPPRSLPRPSVAMPRNNLAAEQSQSRVHPLLRVSDRERRARAAAGPSDNGDLGPVRL